MKNSKVIELLATFQPREWKSFRYFLHRNAVLETDPVYRFLDILQAHFQAAEAAEWDAAYIFQAVFSADIPYDNKRLRYLQTELTAKIEAFWMEKELAAQPLMQRNLLISALKKRRLTKWAGLELRKAEAEIAAEAAHGLDALVTRFVTRMLAYELAALQDNRSPDHSLREIMDAAVLLQHAAHLKYGNVLVNLRNVVATPVTAEEIAGLRQIGESPTHAEEPIIAVYYHILLTLTEPDDEAHYHRLKAILQRHHGDFDREELGQMYAFALNYSIKKLNQGHATYLQELFELYQTLVEQETIFEGKYILQQHFKNIVTVGIRLGEYGWTEEFIRTYSRRITPEARKNAYT
ncbi:MAG: hypothetical protein AAF570_13465, partial [Bacteroidota bacterium]